jgi:hypothetical protein
LTQLIEHSDKHPEYWPVEKAHYVFLWLKNLGMATYSQQQSDQQETLGWGENMEYQKLKHACHSWEGDIMS